MFGGPRSAEQVAMRIIDALRLSAGAEAAPLSGALRPGVLSVLLLAAAILVTRSASPGASGTFSDKWTRRICRGTTARW